MTIDNGVTPEKKPTRRTAKKPPATERVLTHVEWLCNRQSLVSCRFEKLIELDAPRVILLNELRMIADATNELWFLVADVTEVRKQQLQSIPKGQEGGKP